MDEKIKKTKNSIKAIEQYISLYKESANRHKANILVHIKEKDLCANALPVFLSVNENSAKVIIEKFDTIYGDCVNIFTTRNSTFSINYKTLHIETKDILNNEISIYVTKV